MEHTFKTISPIDGSIYCERAYAGDVEIEAALQRAHQAQREWCKTSLEERRSVCRGVTDYFEKHVDAMAKEITWQMGRPIRYTPFEISKGVKERADYMVGIAESELSDVEIEPVEGFKRFIRKEPLGTFLILAPWNYPYLTAVNSITPAIMAGNTVILKHAEQTPLCAERWANAFAHADAPAGVFQFLHLAHAQIPKLIADSRISGVSFTGSVAGGQAIQKAIGSRFITAGLELGGKDPAYVADDANVAQAAESLVDGAFFNSGQSCCAVERIYVHEHVYDEFVERFRTLTLQYVVGDPTNADTTLGPLVRAAAAEHAQKQLDQATTLGGQLLIDKNAFPKQPFPYFNPQAVLDVSHQMQLMQEESFAPIVGIMKVNSDTEAIALMNDSRYGLTASVWTQDEERALRIGDAIETGTVFMNRCDYLDPSLAWTGVKDSGKGCSLSALGYQHLTRPKSFHLKLKD